MHLGSFHDCLLPQRIISFLLAGTDVARTEKQCRGTMRPRHLAIVAGLLRRSFQGVVLLWNNDFCRSHIALAKDVGVLVD